jgi:hypothetical protein
MVVLPLPKMNPGLFALLETRLREQTDMLHLAASLSRLAGATIIDGGNHFNAYPVVHRVRQATTSIDQVNTLQVARAFNCHQMVELVQRVPFNGAPCLVIDLLDTFVDDALTLSHRRRMLSQILEGLQRINCHQAVIVSLTPPKEDIDQWHTLAALIRRAATTTLEEGFMGKTIPTINQIVQQAEMIITRFSRVIQPEEREALEELFVSARKHIAAISEANYLLPFEVVQQAMLLEQQKEILDLRQRVADLERRL